MKTLKRLILAYFKSVRAPMTEEEQAEWQPYQM